MAVYGNLLTRHNGSPITINSEPKNENDYGASKYEAEQIIREKDDIAWTILRLPSLYDQNKLEYFDGFMPFLKLKIVPVFSASTRRSILHIDNLGRLIEAILENDCYAHRILLPCDAISPTVEEIIEKIGSDRGYNLHSSKLIGTLMMNMSKCIDYLCNYTGSAFYKECEFSNIFQNTYMELSFKK